jgi:amino acid permease
MYSIIILKGIGLIFDGLISVYYRRFRRMICRLAKKHSMSYYSRETAPFLLVFGGTYALKIGVIAILSIFSPSLSLSIQTVKIAILGMVVSTLAFAWSFRKLTKWVYTVTRKLDQESKKRKKEQQEKKERKL